MHLLLTECHQNDRDEEVEHHKGHKHNTGANEECAKYWIVVKNLKDTEEIGKKKNSHFLFWYSHNHLKTDLFIVENAKLQANHGLCSIQQSPIRRQLPPIHQIRLKSIQMILVLAGTPEGHIRSLLLLLVVGKRSQLWNRPETWWPWRLGSLKYQPRLAAVWLWSCAALDLVSAGAIT